MNILLDARTRFYTAVHTLEDEPLKFLTRPVLNEAIESMEDAFMTIYNRLKELTPKPEDGPQ